jgi:hypothetical protein
MAEPNIKFEVLGICHKIALHLTYKEGIDSG